MHYQIMLALQGKQYPKDHQEPLLGHIYTQTQASIFTYRNRSWNIARLFWSLIQQFLTSLGKKHSLKNHWILKKGQFQCTFILCTLNSTKSCSDIMDL